MCLGRMTHAIIPGVERPRRFDLPVPEPYAFEPSTFRFRMFGDDLASRWIDGGLHRVLRSGLPVRIDEERRRPAWGTPDQADVDEIAHLLGAHFDLAAFEAAHPEVYARSPGFRPPLLADPFEMLVTSVTAQQISLRAAAVIRGGLVQRFGRRRPARRRRVVGLPAPGRRARAPTSRG